ncbi:unnamed protein product [Effrenium voratum]|uniref:Extradiol ring-cleavage dioxygenase class III enzyme subunit B domain-containing protein n=1 Tax=Effrenium voratum TaxID=2562239 RepID=A0AA36MZW8_9DINO|nr:unnamed protein product [Effrenium voratum]
MFDGCAGVYLQETRTSRVPELGARRRSPAAPTAPRQECFENAFQPIECVNDMPLQKLPTLFVSHGVGVLPLLAEKRLSRSLAQLPRRLQLDEHRVRCILVISAHWETKGELEVTLRRTHAQGLLYDYAGAPEEAYEVHHRYHPPGDAQVSGWVLDLLEAKGIAARHNSGRNLDHGVFVPLVLMSELRNVPVVQLSLPALSGQRGTEVAKHCLEVGRALAPLRSRGVLILGSGLSSNPVRPQRLERWTERLKHLCCQAPPSERYAGLRQWTSAIPHAREVHGREEHLLPLHVVVGAALDDPGEVLGDYREHERAMTHFKFG